MPSGCCTELRPDRGPGEFCHSLNLTDVHTPWTETSAVTETTSADPPFPTVSTGLHRKKNEAKKKEKTILIGYILKLHDDTPKVTFLFCATGCVPWGKI